MAARLRSCPAPKEKDELFHEVHLRIDRDEVLPSIEATGELLHRRGYRKHVGVAPLRETLAAACARLLDDADRARVDAPVWDPCCGSGTMLCEWLLSGTQQSACGPRKFAFERWPIHNSAAYEAWLGTLPTGSAATERRAIGSDRNRRVLTAAKHNAERASLGEVCEWREGDFREVADNIPVGYRVLTNLPYGKRIAGSHQSAKVFAAMDALVAKRSDLRPALVLVVGDPPERARCDWKLAAEFPNGGIRVKAWIVR